jgi:hypothetical protein
MRQGIDMDRAAPGWQTMWPLFLGPMIWALHFLTIYIFAAVFCAKYALAADFTLVRIAVAVATVVALAGIGLVGFQGFQQWRVERDLRQDKPTDVDRRQLLGQAAILLCGLSAVAVVYGAMPALYIGSCR